MRAKVFVDYFRIAFREDFRRNFVFRDLDGVSNNFLLDLEEGAGSFGAGVTVFAGGLPLNFDFSKVYGQGRVPSAGGIFDLRAPTEFKITDGIEFDFSIGYDF